jgi:cell division protein FtsL
VEDVKALPNIGFTGTALPGRMPKTKAAPDLSRYRRVLKQREAAEESIAVPRPRVAVRHGNKIGAINAMLFIGVIAAALFIVYNCMQLSVLTAETADMQKTLSAMEKENTQLQTQAEAKLNLEELARAAEEMGMVRPEHENIVYIDLSGTDHAVVVKKPSLWESIIEALSSMTAKVQEFLM